MNDETDSQLLRAYAESDSDPAFAELVRRYIDLVHSAAERMVRDSHQAQDVTQGVFVALAKNAGQLAGRPVLAGWLHGTTQNIAAQMVRTEVRRRAREQEAAAMNKLFAADPEAKWEQIAPHLDDALCELEETDRVALLHRYFRNHDLRTLGATLGISDDAAQKRVSRAVERLRGILARRGVLAGAAGLGLMMSANAVHAAPAGLALTIANAAAAAGTTLATTATATKVIAMTALQKTLLTTTIAVVAGAGIYEARQAAQLRAQLNTLRQQQAPMAEQIQQLQRERDEVVAQRAEAMFEPARTPTIPAETLRLRGEVGRLRSENAEMRRPVTQEMVAARYQTAQELSRRGESAAALQEYLWCFDEGMPRSPSYAGVRTSFLLSSIASLGENYPPAMAALRERRDAALQRMQQGDHNAEAALDFAALNRALHEDQNTLTAFDQISPDDPLRPTLASAAYDELIEKQRYSDALSGRPYATISALFELEAVERPLPPNIANPEAIRKTQRDTLIMSTARNIEMLAGAGDVEHARALAARLLEYDGTRETKALLQQHAIRAGRPDLLQGLNPP